MQRSKRARRTNSRKERQEALRAGGGGTSKAYHGGLPPASCTSRHLYVSYVVMPHRTSHRW